MPEWMNRSENYEPDHRSTRFAGGNALRLLSLLTVFRNGSRGASVFSRLPCCPAHIRLLMSLLVILLVSCAHNMLFCYILLAAVILVLCAMPSGVLLRAFLPALSAAAFSAIIMVPALFLGSPASMLTISVKVFLSVSVLAIMASTTPWNELTSGLRTFHVPNVFIFTLDTTLKYIAVIGTICSRMLDALTLRAVGSGQSSRSQALGGILGTAFLKSRKMAGDMADAMVCRGFDGEYRHTSGAKDRGGAFWLLLCVLLTAVFFWFETHGS